MDPGCGGQVACIAVLGRDGKYIAAGTEKSTVTIRGYLIISNLFAHVPEAVSPTKHVLGNPDGHFCVLIRGQIQAVYVPAVLKNDGLLAQRGELDVKLGEVGNLLRRCCLSVINIQIHSFVFVTVGQKIDFVTHPHGNYILGLVLSNVLELPGLKIVNPHIVRHAAAIPLPGPELAEDPVVGQFLVIGRVGGKTTTRQWKLLGQPTVRGYGEELSVETIMFPHPGAEENLPAAMGPAHDNVVRAHTVGDVIATKRSGIGKPYRDASFGGHKIHFGVAVILTSKRQLRTIR